VPAGIAKTIVIIINADDFGRSRKETEAALSCYRAGRITSTSAMMFMEDSERGAEKGLECGIDTGLHLNLSQLYDGRTASGSVAEAQARIVRFMKSSKYAVLLYHPGLRKAFREVFNAQWDEFIRLYGKPPTHVDGHQHRHLCANVLVDEVIPRGQKVRRNFSFFPGDKSTINRIYRRFIDYWLARRYRLTDYFFSLPQSLDKGRLPHVARLSKSSKVELMTHPCKVDEYNSLMSDQYMDILRGVETASYLLV
jgi:predicted glycoside hydrolase/deacetylase ChbG (UPF0249 family)